MEKTIYEREWKHGHEAYLIHKERRKKRLFKKEYDRNRKKFTMFSFTNNKLTSLINYILFVETEKHYYCIRCERMIPKEDFYYYKYKTMGGRNPVCKKCKNKEIVIRRKNNPNHTKKSRLQERMNVYKISIDYFNELIIKQENKCAICEKEFGNEPHNRSNIDHCHKTGKVRGLLCRKCNHAIGLFGDKTENLINAVKYLSQSP